MVVQRIEQLAAPRLSNRQRATKPNSQETSTQTDKPCANKMEPPRRSDADTRRAI
jgi:hypothetical protein